MVATQSWSMSNSSLIRDKWIQKLVQLCNLCRHNWCLMRRYWNSLAVIMIINEVDKMYIYCRVSRRSRRFVEEFWYENAMKMSVNAFQISRHSKELFKGFDPWFSGSYLWRMQTPGSVSIRGSIMIVEKVACMCELILLGNCRVVTDYKTYSY